MPPTRADEDAFMADLLAGIDASAFDLPPSSQSPVKPKPHKRAAVGSPSKSAYAKTNNAKTGTNGRSAPAKHASSAAVTPKSAAVGRAPLSPRKITPARPGGANLKPSPKSSQPQARTQPAVHTLPPPTQTVPPSQPATQDAKRKADTLLDFLGLAPAKRVAADVRRGTQATQTQTQRKSQSPTAVKSHAAFKTPTRPAPPLPAVSPVRPSADPPPSSQEDYDADWDLDALAIMDEAALLGGPEKYPLLHPPVPPRPADYTPPPWARCVVDSIHEGLLPRIPAPGEDVTAEPAGMYAREKTLVVTLTETGTRRLVHLKDRWADLKVREKDIVNIISHALDTDGIIVVTMKDTSACLIHHPDILVTMTAVADAMPCPRRPLVNQLIKLPEPVSKSMLYGTVLHSLLQGSLSEQSFDRASTARRIEAELSLEDRRLEVWGAGFSPDEMMDDLGPKAEDTFATFGERWVRASPGDDGQTITARDEACGYIAIKGLHDIEESIWSPKWGLQGKVDASIQAVLRRESGEEEEFVAPLEIKTGKSIGGLNHRAQTMLYTLLMEDRYGLPVPAGLLYYSQRSAIVLVEARANEVRALIMSRNELAEWMARERSTKATAEDGVEAFLPETLDRPKDCRRCFSADACMLYRKAVDEVPATEDDPIAELFEEKTGHMTPDHAAFFKLWERLLSLEEQDTTRLRAQLWTMTAKAREKAGRCFADMVLANEDEVNERGKSVTKINRWSYTFMRASSSDSSASLLSGHISRGDPIQISLEPDLLCLARGFVTELTGTSITVGVQSPLEVEHLLKRTGHPSTSQLAFRIDKDELSSGMARMRGNLAHLFLPDGDAKRRSLVVNMVAPQFDSTLAPKPHEIPPSLNDDQRAAMTKVLTAKDYALVLGMPGTGKTTTVAEIIKALVDRGKSVLLTSYTHSAVDTILLKLLNADFQVLRIGNSDKVHPDVRHLTLEAMGPSASADQLEARLMSPPVVATTCLSVNHPLFFRREFDYCIVDEASQITLPTCLGPLRSASTFVLVGDHFQLPPIVRKAEARAGGLDVSLFRRLSDAHPQAVAPLAAQYRMNEDIMHLSNRLIYENRLRCGSEEVARQALALRDRRACRDIGTASCNSDCWVQDLLEESSKAIFVDTDNVPAIETRAGDLVQNPTEAALLYTFARALVASGVPQGDIAAITPYRQQIKLLSSLFASMPRVELLTADKAQGRDKDVVLVSLVRSNESGTVGDLLRDWRRINVSFTRARKKLVIFGSRRTLSTDRLLSDFFALVDEKGWGRTLPENAVRLHPVPVADGGAERKENERKEEDKRSPSKMETEKENNNKKNKKEAVVSRRLLAARPFVREILDDIVEN